MTHPLIVLMAYFAIVVPSLPAFTSAAIADVTPNATIINATTPTMDRPGFGKPGIAWPLGNDPAVTHFKTWKVDKYVPPILFAALLILKLAIQVLYLEPLVR